MRNKAIFTSFRQTWRTPRALFQALDAEFHFDFDPCPPKPEFNGLAIEWKKSNFVNPPYKEIKKWIFKAFFEWQNRGRTIVMLIPARTDTIWWHDYVMCATEIRFIKGRLSFDEGKGRATFPSAIVVFRGAGS